MRSSGCSAVVAPGNALAILDASQSAARAPTPKRLADAIAAAGGAVRQFRAPKEGALAGWIEGEARERGLAAGARRGKGARRAGRRVRARGRHRAHVSDPAGLDGARQARALPRRASRSGPTMSRRSSPRRSPDRSGRSPTRSASGASSMRSAGSIGCSTRPPSPSCSPCSIVGSGS